MSTVWAVPRRGIRETQIFRFLKDARCSVRVVEVRLFKTGCLSDRMPMDRRRWEPGSDLAKIAKEISNTSPIAGTRKPRLWRQTKLSRALEIADPTAVPCAAVWPDGLVRESVGYGRSLPRETPPSRSWVGHRVMGGHARRPRLGRKFGDGSKNEICIESKSCGRPAASLTSLPTSIPGPA